MASKAFSRSTLYLISLIMHCCVHHSRVVLTAPLPSSNVKDCQLELSNRGPDWYKIKRPTPEYLQFDADFVQYIHMPCAAGTVFDLKICGCTNLASYLFESLTLISREMERREFSKVTDDRLRGTADDNLRNFSPRPTERPPTIILNTDTGEDMSKENKDFLVVLTDSSLEDKDNQNILSKGLGISISDVALNRANLPSAKAPQVPDDLRDVRSKDRIQEDTNIFVPFNSDDTDKDILVKSVDDKRDQISNRNLAENPDKKRVPSLLLDARKTINTYKFGDVIPLEFKPIINLSRPLDVQEGIRGDKSKANKSDSTRNHEIIADVPGAVKDKVNKDVLDNIKGDTIKSGFGNIVMNNKIKEDLTDNITNQFVHADTNTVRRRDNSGILSVEDGDEFMKKLADLATKKMSDSRKDSEPDGDRFPLSPLQGPGLSQIEIAQQRVESGQLQEKEPDDEIYFPVVVCHKMKAPELGKQYFKLHLWGIGWIPYRCEEDRIFLYDECACVKERGLEP
ncbi:hypothetical protein CHS0354_028973 [Potamilus streckersoni]|uniref:Uncharacterized protein n=1 Tax=Potamilus streckersoni TaxID=2493646 RepID=A0AAE0SAN5_9BIVA|nr:hypothetical protein CHS0354_028973 [Potamilus streckersoni]